MSKVPVVEFLTPLLSNKDSRIARLADHMLKIHDAVIEKKITESEFDDLVNDVMTTEILIDDAVDLKIRAELATVLLHILHIIKQIPKP